MTLFKIIVVLILCWLVGDECADSIKDIENKIHKNDEINY